MYNCVCTNGRPLIHASQTFGELNCIDISLKVSVSDLVGLKVVVSVAMATGTNSMINADSCALQLPIP